MDVLAVAHRVEADRNMRLGDGQVEHDLHRRVGKQRVHGGGVQAELLGAGAGAALVQVGAGDDRDVREITSGSAEIGGADVAAADQADTNGVHEFSLFTALLGGLLRRSPVLGRLRTSARRGLGH